MSNLVDSLRQQVASGESTERGFIELAGAIDSAFHISRELIAVGEQSRLDRSVVDVNTASVDRPVGTPPRMRRFVRVTVTDTGQGLFGDARTRAFDPFFSTKEGAAGLGLTSVAMIVRNYQGWLHIESDHSGTSIHIHLPALRPLTR